MITSATDSGIDSLPFVAGSPAVFAFFAMVLTPFLGNGRLRPWEYNTRRAVAGHVLNGKVRSHIVTDCYRRVTTAKPDTACDGPRCASGPRPLRSWEPWAPGGQAGGRPPRGAPTAAGG